MRNQLWKRFSSYGLALGLALAACSGDDGAPGPKGDPGQQGIPGEPGASASNVTGTLQVAGGAGVPGAVVTTTPLGLASPATGADGRFTISNVPVGTYTLNVAGPNIAATSIPNVVVVAQPATDVGTKVLAYSPLVVTIAATPIPAGFGKAVPLAATVTGATGPLTYTWSQVSGPTAAAFSDPAIAAPTFTTGTFEAMVAGGKLRNLTAAPARNGLLALTAQHVTNSTYSLKLDVSDGQYTQSKTVSLVTALVSAGQNAGATASVPTKVMVVGNTGTVDVAGWTLDTTGATGSTAVLEAATSKNPWFVPDVPGVYVLKNGAAVVSTITASEWHGAPTAAGCNGCHVTAIDDIVIAKFKDWNNSAHGNHYFKFFEYDLAGNLVKKGDPLATEVVVPTADASVNWTLTAPFRPITTFEFAIAGAEGSHYSESCMRCHTVGMNKAVANGGIDDVTGYVFPTLTDPPPATPNFAAFNALPQGVKDRAGMQCESCHGPLGLHATSGAAKPKAFFDGGTCGVCHDSGSNHDRYNLWAQSGHANLALAEEEGTSTNCGRCHSAQGFVAWAALGFDRSTNLAVAPALADIEPQTCIACHDPHTTTLRVNEALPYTNTSGITVSGAGAGQLCVICHSSRRGAHNDTIANSSYSLPHAAAQSDLFFGQNAYFFGALTDGATMSTHAYVIAGTCTGCHMEGALAHESVTPRNTNHSFRVSADLCAKCHEGASLAALQERTEGGILELKAAIAAASQASIPSVAGFKASVPTTPPTPTGATQCNLLATFTGVPRPTTVAVGLPVGLGHGAGFTFTWSAAQTYTILAADNTTVDCDSVTAGTQPITADIGPVTVAADAPLGVVLDAKLTGIAGTPVLIPTSGDVFKAWWNLALIEDEGSRGAHNPGFTQQVLAVSKAKAAAVPAAP